MWGQRSYALRSSTAERDGERINRIGSQAERRMCIGNDKNADIVYGRFGVSGDATGAELRD